MQVVARELEDRCLNRADAFQLVSSTLTNLGITNFSVHADPWGPQGGPIDKLDFYRSHVAAGCFVYVGGQQRDGLEVDLWGPWP
jgi:hypothetical protein